MIVALVELKTHLRIQHDDEDEYLVNLLAQAQAVAEDYCRVKFDQIYDEATGSNDSGLEPVRLAILLMASFYYENRDIPDMTTYKAMRMAFDSLLYPYRDPVKMF